MSDHNALQKFCTRLTSDPQVWARFRTDPGSVIDEAGLSDAEKSLFTGGDYQALLEALGRTESAFSAIVVNPTKL